MRRVAVLAGVLLVLAGACKPNDFTLDGKADYVFRDGLDSGVWYVAGQETPLWDAGIGPGPPGFEGPALPGDYDGDAVWEAAVYDWNTASLYSNDGGVVTTFEPWLEHPGDWSHVVPVQGNYVGDRATELAAFRPSDATWHIDGVSDPIQFGLPAATPDDLVDVAVPADYDGDGDDDVAVYRLADGTFRTMDDGQIADLPLGMPVPADYDGDGDDDPAVFNPVTLEWSIGDDPPITIPGATFIRPYAVPADYDGDGDDEPAVFDKDTGTWAPLGSTPVTDARASGKEPIVKNYWLVYNRLVVEIVCTIEPTTFFC